jgi:hypothetical protein
MACNFDVRFRHGTLLSSALAAVAYMYFAVGALAQNAPTLTKIDPSTRTNLNNDSVSVTLTGTNFTTSMSVNFDPANVIDADTVASTLKLTKPDNTEATVTFKLRDDTTAPETVNVWVQTTGGHSSKIAFDTGVASSTCLEALKSGGCALLWQVETTSATGSSSQSSNSTTPNILVKLDYQWHGSKSRPQKRLLQQQIRALEAKTLHLDTGLQTDDQEQATPQTKQLLEQQAEANPLLQRLLCKAEGSDKSCSTTLKADQFKAALNKLNPSPMDHLAAHVDFKTGYTQSIAASKVQPTASATGTTTSCPGGTTTTTTTCTSAIPRDAFLAELTTRFSWRTNVEDQFAAEFGVGARGSFQYLIPTNNVVQSGGLTYIDLSSANPQNAVGFYEATGHFHLVQPGHNKGVANTDSTNNVSDLLVVEGGFQNNRGLSQLMASDPQTNTRNRYVARFYVRPELPSMKHTQLTMGIEYSAGINGGPHVVQLFFGTNINPASLFKGIGKSSN